MVAPCVSSDRWADASKPVIVYCVSRKPSGRMYHQYMLSEKPELLIVSVKTNDGDWYSFAVSSRISTISRRAEHVPVRRDVVDQRQQVRVEDVDQ